MACILYTSGWCREHSGLQALQAQPEKPQQKPLFPNIPQNPLREQITSQSITPVQYLSPAKASWACLPESRESSSALADTLPAWADNFVNNIRSAPDMTTVLVLVFQSLSTLFLLVPLNE